MPFKQFWMLVCIIIGLQGLFLVYADEQVLSICDFDALQVAIQTAGETGGIIRLDCKGSIFFERQLVIQSDIHLIGLGDVVLDGDNRTRLFYVTLHMP